MKLKKLERNHPLQLSKFNLPNFHHTGSIIGMKRLYYGKNALLVKQNGYIYNVSSRPEFYDSAL
jgi:hypothetical protein